ncbi:OLC1v1012722C1 [Oldenlandia corymbosa var. corymbosa]|uniref:OLC1v1012722C1 n=1 Tax=Oldenlandia corymbosa var. corymbosa TaxID=529605 RepID=A0AAV1DX91_OLDCO|nr:OLC1v1012722C1 [Oldenlandia corymbosa var. corymbosa]
MDCKRPEIISDEQKDGQQRPKLSISVECDTSKIIRKQNSSVGKSRTSSVGEAWPSSVDVSIENHDHSGFVSVEAAGVYPKSSFVSEKTSGEASAKSKAKTQERGH